MRKITRRALTVAAAAVVSAGIAVAPASAGPLAVDVSLPGESGATAQLVAQNDGTVVGAALSGGVMLCSDVGATKALTGEGQVELGSNLPPGGAITPPAGIGAVTSNLVFSNCSVSSQVATVTVYHVGGGESWGLYVDGETSGGVTPGYVTGVKVDVDLNGIGCHATFDANGSPGTIHGEYTNPQNPGDPGSLSLPFNAVNDLVASDVQNCPTNIVKNGDTVTLAGTIQLYGKNSTNNEGPTVNAHT